MSVTDRLAARGEARSFAARRTRSVNTRRVTVSPRSANMRARLRVDIRMSRANRSGVSAGWQNLNAIT